MSKKFNISIIPDTEHDVAAIEALENLVADQVDEDGKPTSTTFAQLIMPDEAAAYVLGRLFTGAAAKYLQQHVRAANKMQNAQESTPEGRE